MMKMVNTITGWPGGGVEPGVIGPLVEHAGLEGRFLLADAVLADDRRTAGADQLVDAVVDLRVHMIGPSRQHDNGFMFLSGLLDDGISPGPHLGKIAVVFLLSGFQCFLHLFQGDTGEVFLQNGGHFMGEIFWPVQADVIGDEHHIGRQGHIAADHFRVIGHHRAVVAVVARAPAHR